MEETWLIRHAESSANVGAVTSYPETIPLTQKGLEQARCIATHFDKQPDLIAVSPYLRAKLTAAPVLARYPNARSEQWEVQEFTYLDRARCHNTTVADRKPLVAAYWSRNEPYYCDGEGAESFAELIQRARGTIERIKGDNSEFIAVFTHAQFIQAMMWLLWQKVETVGTGSMSSFHAFTQAVIMPNGGIVRIRQMKNEDDLYFTGVSTSHLPADLITS
jgi:broad specificity phosphatase PhoE